MRDYLEPMLGSTGAMIAQFAIALFVIAAVIFLIVWLIRLLTGRIGASAARGRQPRLGLLDALPIDHKRRLVLVRRDNVEHLILIGGAADLVVEGAIQRLPVAQRRAETAARGAQSRQLAPIETETPLGSVVERVREDHVEAAAAVKEAAPANIQETANIQENRGEARVEPVLSTDGPLVAENGAPQVRIERSREARASDRMKPEAHIVAEMRSTIAVEPPVEAAARPTAVAPEPTVAAPVAPAAAEAVRPAPQEQPARGRPFGSFFTSQRGRQPGGEASPQGSQQRTVGASQMPLSRATPLAPPRDVEPAPETEQTESAPQSPESPRGNPQQAQPARMEPQRPERVRAGMPPRPTMPPAPPVSPATLGEAPYGAPVADPDQPPRFQPIFDVNPANQAEPVRPVRLSRDTHVAPSPEAGEDVSSEAVTATEASDRQPDVGDLEKEMARLLGEISSTRRR